MLGGSGEAMPGEKPSDGSAMGAGSADALHVVAEATKRAWRDRRAYANDARGIHAFGIRCGAPATSSTSVRTKVGNKAISIVIINSLA